MNCFPETGVHEGRRSDGCSYKISPDGGASYIRGRDRSTPGLFEEGERGREARGGVSAASCSLAGLVSITYMRFACLCWSLSILHCLLLHLTSITFKSLSSASGREVKRYFQQSQSCKIKFMLLLTARQDTACCFLDYPLRAAIKPARTRPFLVIFSA